ncbi:uncharacterized protein rab11fip5a isoform X2 [Sphaeramia orbicularis]|uniref:uncharacterized protein rab11fip5a isoform X2 n=1 Tax=Sphaeramia orbicularis TaxID=375764 RepID=UPI00117D4A7F|nr:uncharacterized protein LOC115413339 isoform X2 [Sphaeramia orbicularis]
MSSLNPDEDQKWLPTHVQVTVLRGRGLRGKGKHGTSDVYTIIQLGKEKYSTCVAEKTTEPEWREECSFEMQPGVLESRDRGSYPAGSNELVLTVMHRALIGLDVFLGQAVIPLDKLFHDSRCVKNEWYRLNSKTGKKEKERGDIQISVQFTRNNLTASMYDLVMKDKGVSTFIKLKERMRGKRRSSEEDSSSAVLPGGYGSLVRMRQRLPSDGGGEEDYEDDEGGEVRRSKMRTFFLRGKLRKSSDTRSSTSLGSESSESSSRGGSLSPTAGISVVVSDLSNSPSNSSNLTADNSPEHTANTSPKLSSPRCEFGDEAGEITIAVPQPSACVNGSHATKDSGSGKPAGSLGLGLLQKTLPLSTSLQNLSPRTSTDLSKGVGDGRRWSFDKPGEEEKAAIAAALEKSGPMVSDEEEHLGEATLLKPTSSSSSSSAAETEGKKPRRNFFSHGRSDSGKGSNQSKDESEEAPGAEDKHRGWFGSKDSHSKLSLVVSPKLESSTDPHPPPLHLLGPTVDPSLHHPNPFYPSQSTPPPISPCNPFFSLLQQNPFYEDMLTAQPLKPSPPPLPFLSSSRPPIAQLFPQASNPIPTLTHHNPPAEDSVTGLDVESEVMTKDENRPLSPALSEKQNPLSPKPSNPFVSAKELEMDSEWDQSFDEFAAGRLQSPEDLTTDCKTQQNTPSGDPPKHSINKGTFLPTADADQHININDTLNRQPLNIPCAAVETHKAISQLTDTNIHHFYTFAKLLDTIPEHNSLEDDHKSSNMSTKPDVTMETNRTKCTTNTDLLTDTNMHQMTGQTSSQKINSSSPDPGSSGLGSSAEEDFLSCVSSYSASDKLSASSSEESEVQNCESSFLDVEKYPEAEDDVMDKSDDLSLTVINDHGRKGLEELPPSQSVDLPVVAAIQEGADTQMSNYSIPNLLPDVAVSTPPDNELCSTHPSIFIITSSPGVTQTFSDSIFESTTLGEDDASQPFKVFGDFLNTSHISPSQDNTLLHTQTSDQSSNSSFLQSLYVSADSQEYQTCQSETSSKCISELSETLHSANSTICEELSNNQDLEDSTKEEIYPPDVFEEFYCVTDKRGATLESNVESEKVMFCEELSKNQGPEESTKEINTSDVFEESYCVMEERGATLESNESSNEGNQKTGESEESCFGVEERRPILDSDVHSANLKPCEEMSQIEGVKESTTEGTNPVDVLEESRCGTNENEATCNSVNSTLYVEQSEIQGLKESSNEENKNTSIVEESCCEVEERRPNFDTNLMPCEELSKIPGLEESTTEENKRTVVSEGRATFESDFTIGFDFGLVPVDSYMSCNPKQLCKESVDGVFSKRLEAENATLHRSLSESKLAPDLNELRRASFGSDPGAMKESSFSSSQIHLTSLAPSLTPESSSSLLALCPLPPFANLVATSPSNTADPQPMQPDTQEQTDGHQNSPHPVKPLTTAILAEEKRTEGRSVLATGLEKLKSTINPGRSSHLSDDTDRKKPLTEGAGSYYHLTHSELVALLVQREAELERQKTEFERQRVVLAKREVELRRLKPQVKDLEDYIDTLLVRIMEQKPTLLQVRSKFK